MADETISPQARVRSSGVWAVVQLISGIVLLLLSVVWAYLGDYPRATYLLVFSLIMDRNAYRSAKESGLE
jgi:hypothetical protein